MSDVICALCGDAHPHCDHFDRPDGAETPVCLGCPAVLNTRAADTVTAAKDYQHAEALELPALPTEREYDPTRHVLVRPFKLPSNNACDPGEAA